jgi:hypothetical protein
LGQIEAEQDNIVESVQKENLEKELTLLKSIREMKIEIESLQSKVEELESDNKEK